MKRFCKNRRRCYNCGGYGHIQRFCRQKRQDNHGGIIDDPSIEENIEQPISKNDSEKIEDVREPEIKIVEKVGSHVEQQAEIREKDVEQPFMRSVIIDGTIDGVKATIIVEKNSPVSVIDHNLYQRMKRSSGYDVRCEVIVEALENMPNYVCTYTPEIGSGDSKFIDYFHVMNNVAENQVVIGNDILEGEEYDLKEICNGYFMFKNKRFPVRAWKGSSNVNFIQQKRDRRNSISSD